MLIIKRTLSYVGVGANILIIVIFLVILGVKLNGPIIICREE